MKTQLNKEIKLIQTDAIRLLVQNVLASCPTCFWHMPASTTGKYHPAFSLGEGGLIRHTRAVVHYTRHLLQMDGYTGIECDMAIAAAILHDCCKKSDDEKYTAFDHPTRAARLIQNEATLMACTDDSLLPPSTVRSLCAMVAAHMGRWNVNTRTGEELPTPLTPLERLVHTADYLASRKDLTIENLF